MYRTATAHIRCSLCMCVIGRSPWSITLRVTGRNVVCFIHTFLVTPLFVIITVMLQYKIAPAWKSTGAALQIKLNIYKSSQVALKASGILRIAALLYRSSRKNFLFNSCTFIYNRYLPVLLHKYNSKLLDTCSINALFKSLLLNFFAISRVPSNVVYCLEY